MPTTALQRLVLATLVATLLLVTIGATVRAAGAGLGCPDWPRCFGGWVPPSSAAELPPGFDAAQFNPTLMWTEYVNRLFGVLVGFFMLATLGAALLTARQRPKVLWPTLAVVVLTGVQGWLGGKVVSAELEPFMVTVHLVMALLIVAVLLYVARHAFSVPSLGNVERRWLLAVGGLLALQIVAGTQVRAWVQEVRGQRPTVLPWLPETLWPDHLHRLAAVAIIVVCGIMLWRALRIWRNPRRTRLTALMLGLAATQTLVGVGLAYGGIPPVLQVLHVTFVSLLFAVWFWLALLSLERR